MPQDKRSWPAITDDEQRALLKRIRPKLRRLAATLTRDTDFIDELAQEGWIAVWKEVNSKGSLPEGMLMMAARNKMFNRIKFDTQQCRDIRRSIPVSAINWEGDTSDLFGAVDVDLTAVEDAYHEGRILEAVNKLPKVQRAYVIRRFWHGWTKAPLEVYFSKNPNDIWRYAKKNLERELVKVGVME